MNAPLINLSDTSPSAMAAREMQLELSYLPIALALDINKLLEGCKFHDRVSNQRRTCRSLQDQ